MAPAPLVTPISGSADPEPTIAIIFNERSAPDQVAELIGRAHSFVVFESFETVDEIGRAAFLLVVFCETANADDLFDLIGSRLPDYIQSRRFPNSLIPKVRAAAAAKAVRAAGDSRVGEAPAQMTEAAPAVAAAPEPSSEVAAEPDSGAPGPAGIMLSRPGVQSRYAS